MRVCRSIVTAWQRDPKRRRRRSKVGAKYGTWQVYKWLFLLLIAVTMLMAIPHHWCSGCQAEYPAISRTVVATPGKIPTTFLSTYPTCQKSTSIINDISSPVMSFFFFLLILQMIFWIDYVYYGNTGWNSGKEWRREGVDSKGSRHMSTSDWKSGPVRLIALLGR